MKKKIFIVVCIILLIICGVFLCNFIHEKSLENTIDNTKFQIKNNKECALYDKKEANAFLQTYGYLALVGESSKSFIQKYHSLQIMSMLITP